MYRERPSKAFFCTARPKLTGLFNPAPARNEKVPGEKWQLNRDINTSNYVTAINHNRNPFLANTDERYDSLNML